MRKQIVSLRLGKAGLAAAALLAFPALNLPASQVTVVEGADSSGLHVVLVVPADAHPQSIGLARQIATLPLRSGKLSIVETATLPDESNLPSFLDDTLTATPDWIWLHRGAGDEAEAPTLSLVAAGQGDLHSIAARTLGTDVSVHLSPPQEPALAHRGVLTFSYPPRTPLSRQNRYTRELVVALLRQTGNLGPETSFDWKRLGRYSSRLIALYDAEGIGGGGPVSLERIAATKIEEVGIYRVCGEDIREGALQPALTAIFPGGSGRGIGNGLQEEGREILRSYISGGGGYLGVCAGAYFAASGLDNYLQAIDLRHSQPWTRGRSTVEIELTEEGRKLFGDEKTVLSTRYANGPVFLPADQEGDGDPEFVVLARFTKPSTDRNEVVREEMVGEAAIGSRSYGEGRMLIISPHPESHQEHYEFVARAIAWTMSLN